MAMVLGIPVMVYIVFVSVCVYWSRERKEIIFLWI